MKKLLFSLLATATLFSAAAKERRLASVTSPDGTNTVNILHDGQTLRYEVFRQGTRILAPSPLSMTVDGQTWGSEARCKRVIRREVDRTEHFTVARKYPSVQENYREVQIVYPHYRVEVRAYADGVAYRFVGTEAREGLVEGERIGYEFAEDYPSYTLLTKNLQNWFEENYTERNLSQLPTDSISLAPVMVRVGGCNVLLAEANLYNYPGCYLRPTGRGFEGVQAAYPRKEEFFDGTNKIYATEREPYLVKCRLDRAFPWRVTGIFDSDADILGSELIYLLSDKTTDDYSWIRPGKVLWDWWNHNNIYGVDFKAGINTETYLYMIDFAAEHDLEYLLIDEGWSARDDLMTLNPEVDMPAICRHAEEKGVGILLWAKWINVDRQLDEAFDQMKAWGVKGVKIDFMDRNDAKMVSFYERVARKAAACHFLVDFHGSYPNEGMRAKYPLLMTREGVVGLEYNKWSDRATPRHDLIIPFLRMWVGPMDYTPGAMLNAQKESFRINAVEPMSQGTRAHQLAMYVVYESPLQMLSDSPTKYLENRECFEFLKEVPTVWDETRPLFGKIGEYIGIARRSGDRWFVGIMGGEQPQQLQLDLSFLGEGQYVITSFQDGANAEVNGKDYRRTSEVVTADRRIPVNLATGGGFAAVICKK